MNGFKKRKKRVNHANMFAVILSAALIINLLFYWLPDSMLGIPVKKVDLLSDIRLLSEVDSGELFALSEDGYDDKVIDFFDSGVKTADSKDTPSDPETQQDTNSNQNKSDITQVQNNASTDSTETKVNITTTKEKPNTDYLVNTNIEDFTSGHTGLRRFFAALNNINYLGRPVRIAFVGDSFIEGDILVADFRAKMQEYFGGKGIGFIPITSNVEQYRPTIKQSAKGWRTYSIIKNRSRKYVISGMQFEPESDNATVNIQTVDMYPGLEEVSSLKFLYSKNDDTDIILKSDTDTAFYELPPTETVTQYEIKGRFTKGVLQLKNARGLNAIGMAIEDDYGVIVDNLSIRGNSGIIMSDLCGESCRELQHVRPYDLIVLQYGLNVASDSVRDYGWYRNIMIPVVEHVQNCFPGADVLIMGVSDRSRKSGGTYSTMPAVLSLLRAQRQIAMQTEVTFWSTFAAMGGHNSMVKYVNSNWASKDYTHLSFRGGREVANALFDAIITEKELYDDYERLVER